MGRLTKAEGVKSKDSCCQGWRSDGKIQLHGRSQAHQLAVRKHHQSLTSQCPINVSLCIDWTAGWQEVGSVGYRKGVSNFTMHWFPCSVQSKSLGKGPHPSKEGGGGGGHRGRIERKSEWGRGREGRGGGEMGEENRAGIPFWIWMLCHWSPGEIGGTKHVIPRGSGHASSFRRDNKQPGDLDPV